MKQAAFVLSIIATALSVFASLAVGWLYLERKVKYITSEDNIQ